MTGKVSADQASPSVDVIPFAVNPDSAMNRDEFAPIASQSSDKETVLDVHVMPSDETAALVELDETAQKDDPLQQRALQFDELGSVLSVHVIPSGEVAAVLVPKATEQKTDPFQAMSFQFRELASVLRVHAEPLAEVAAPRELAAIAQKTVPPAATFQFVRLEVTVDGVCEVHVTPVGELAIEFVPKA
jgi:hypothetical protein